MPYKSSDIPETVSVLAIAFVVGAIAQFIKQKVDVTQTNKNIVWFALASGLSSMIIIGLLYEYTGISPAFLIAISGIAGWAGVAILGTLASLLDDGVQKFAKKQLDIEITKGKEGTNEISGTDKDSTGT